MATPIPPVQDKPHTADVNGTIEKRLNDSKVIKFERYSQKKTIDALNKSHVLDLERRIQNKIIPLLGGTKVFAQTRAVQKGVNKALNPPPPVLSPSADDIHQPVEVNGFYKVTGEMEATYYVTTPWPGFSVGSGWTGIGILGIIGNIHITGSNNTPGVIKVTSLTSETYLWSFTMQSDVEQFIEGVIHSTGASLYPPNQVPHPTAMRSGPVYGKFTVIAHIPRISFTAPPPEGTAVGWSIAGLPTVSACKIISLEGMNATLHPLDDSIPENTEAPIFIRGAPTMAIEPKYTEEFIPAKLYTSDLEKRKPVKINPKVMGGKNYVPLRDLGTDIKDSEGDEEKYLDIKGRGFSAGSVLSLFAVGPQDRYLTHQDPAKSQYHNTYRQHTNFVMYQKIIPFPPANPAYQGQTVTLELRPKDLGHLISNMYFTCTVPAIASGYGVNENIGRALIKQIDLMVNETVIETLYDDWYIIRDQMFLDADEQLGMFSMVGGLKSNVTSSSSQTIVCPLEFFFCRRHSHANKGRERLRKPFFPVCSMWNQRIYIRFTFNPYLWWTNSPTPVDISNLSLITEEILLDTAEKLYYQNTPLRFIVNRVKKEAPTSFGAGNVSGIFGSTATVTTSTVTQASLQLSASFPVQSIFWFFRARNYEAITDSRGAPTGSYYNQRYNYGYTSDYIKTGIPVNFPSSNNAVTNFIDPISTAKITLNNVDILSTFKGSLYYTYKQPMEHGLSVPSRNIYTYSFGLTPAEYNQGGFLNFSKLNSQTSTLTLVFNPSYSSQISQGYILYLFYYGYSVLEFDRGFARLAFS
jgi:Large eukaryotic DNA virus major capsid protein/Major capsid protein N-terminus